ncbi:MAG: winged helix-turn-helix domain-containing protein [Pseudoclavibacter sp.]
MVESLSLAQARRIALGAQGFAGAKRSTAPSSRTLAAEIERLRVLQIDSVNVWERSHYMPLFSRLGPYDRTRLDRLASGPGTAARASRREHAPLTEYWAHEATFLPIDDLPLFAFRKRSWRDRLETKYGDQYVATAKLRAWLLDELAEKGPMRASEIEHDENQRTGPWWGWSAVKRALEFLFLTGEVVAAPRVGFERRYALPHHALPDHLVDTEHDADDARRELVRRAAIALGVATAGDLADYFRIPVTTAKTAIDELESSGELVPVAVEGWNRGARPLPAWRHRDARLPRRIDRTALLSPFDPVVWFRDRALRLYDFHYRIEIYTPAPKRQFGYYTLPVLIGDRVSARVDLKNDRKRGVLRVQSAWLEEHAPANAAPRVAESIREAAAWQGLEGFEVQDWGDLALPLANELGAPLVPRGA